jgi:predicted phosphodiesterase
VDKNKDLDDYIISKLNLGFPTSDIYVLVRHYFDYRLSRKTFQNHVGVVRRKYKARIIKPSDAYENEIVRMKASNQRLQDKNRIANKIMREHNRYLNATSELYEDILNKLKSFSVFKVEKVKTKFEIVDKTAIVQLTDLHLGEKVTLEDTLGFNEYGIEMGSKRLWRFAREIEYTLGDTVSEIVVAMTGDLLNSDRRIDEMLTNTDNRSEVFVQALQVLGGFLTDLARRYKITVLSVVGNESRIDQDPPYRNPMHNYDFLIHKCLSMLLSNCKDRITFLDINRNYETVYRVGGLNILFFHGYKYKPNMLDKIIRKYNMMGTLIDYIITGHIHSASTEEFQSRSGSLVGSNNYSIFKLHAIAKATQVLYNIKREENMNRASISPIIVDLQDVGGCEMYKFDPDVCKIN